jgi:hypothetical protein
VLPGIGRQTYLRSQLVQGRADEPVKLGSPAANLNGGVREVKDLGGNAACELG